MNRMYRVITGWIKWRGKKYSTGQTFIASSPNEHEAIVLQKQCEPVKTATARVISAPIKLSETGKTKKQSKGD